MKFSLCVLTVGLLVATAAGSPSNVNLLGKDSSVLYTGDLAPYVPTCSNIFPFGQLKSFTITDCYPGHVQIAAGSTVYLTFTFYCGASESSFILHGEVIGHCSFTLYPVEQYPCQKGGETRVVFEFPIQSFYPSQDYTARFNLVGATSGLTESCVQPTIRITPGAK